MTSKCSSGQVEYIFDKPGFFPRKLIFFAQKPKTIVKKNSSKITFFQKCSFGNVEFSFDKTAEKFLQKCQNFSFHIWKGFGNCSFPKN